MSYQPMAANNYNLFYFLCNKGPFKRIPLASSVIKALFMFVFGQQVCACMYVCMYMCVCVCINMYVCMYVCMYVSMFV